MTKQLKQTIIYNNLRTGAISHPTHLRIRAKHGTGKPVRLILEPRVELLKLKLAARLGESAGEPRIQGGTGGQELGLEIHLADWSRRVAGAERIRLAASGGLGRCAACEEEKGPRCGALGGGREGACTLQTTVTAAGGRGAVAR